MNVSITNAIHRETVRPEWIDYNGHMNVAYYNLAFDHALDQLFDTIDVGADYVKRTNNSMFVLEAHVNYLQEVVLGDPLVFELHVLDHDTKRLHLFLQMVHADAGYRAATSEQLAVHVDLESRRSTPFPDPVMREIERLSKSHAAQERAKEVGAVIGIRRKPGAAA